MTDPGRLVLITLTEDVAEGAFETVGALIGELLRVNAQYVDLRHLGSRPLPEGRYALMLRAARWKSTSPADEADIRELARTIANELMRSSTAVMFHFDGDRPWSDGPESDNVRHFESSFRPRIEAALTSRQQPDRIANLVALVPFYSIEAWCYQNIRVARQFCAKNHASGCADILARWEADRASIDEEWQPKEMLCLRDTYNRDLAISGYPTEDAYLADTSFAKAAEAVGRSPVVQAFLAQFRG